MNGFLKVIAGLIGTAIIAIASYGAVRDHALTTVSNDTEHNSRSINKLETEVDTLKRSVFRTEYIVIELGKRQGVEVPDEDM